MSIVDVWLFGALLLLIIAAAMLGAAEAALLRVQRVRLQVDAEAGDSRSKTMLTLLDELPQVLNTVLLVVLLVQIAAATTAGTIASNLFGSLGVTVASIVLTFVLFVYSEAIPKTYAVGHPETVARASAPLLRLLTSALRPVVFLLVWFADLQAPGTGIAAPSAPTEAELLRLASDAAATGTIDESDRVLIDRAFLIGDQRADDIYVPRRDIIAVPNTATVREAFDLAIGSGHRRIPIYRDSIDTIVGVVRLSDMAKAAIDTPDAPASRIAHKPLIVPESRRVIDLLADMQQSGVHFAVAIDEHGGTAGIVTIEDVAALLVGPIAHEGETREIELERTSATTWIVSGSTDVDDLSRELAIPLPDGDWNTVAGLILGIAGEFPSVGDSFDTGDSTFEIVSTSGLRITSVRLTRHLAESE